MRNHWNAGPHRALRLGNALGLGLPLGAALAGCGGDQAVRVAEPVVRDSAGVEIVEYSGALPDTPLWEADLGGSLHLPGDFFQVRGATELSDGTIVVADGGSRQLRYFDDAGAPGDPAVVGGEGEGPGEFMQLSSMHRWPGDSVVVFDIGLRRLTLFGPDGELARTFGFEVSDDVPFANLLGVHGDGAMAAGGFSRLPDGGPSTGVQRYPSPVYAFHDDGTIRSVTGVEFWTESWFEAFDGGFSVGTVPFARAERITVGRDHLVRTSTGSGEVRMYDPTGRLVRLIREIASPRAITTGEGRTEIERIIEGASPAFDADDLRRRLEGTTLPETLPVFGRTAHDRTGNLWLELYRAPRAEGPAEPTEWVVLAPDGSFSAKVRLPTNFSPHEIGVDYLLGVLVDDFDVEQVVRIPLAR